MKKQRVGFLLLVLVIQTAIAEVGFVRAVFSGRDSTSSIWDAPDASVVLGVDDTTRSQNYDFPEQTTYAYGTYMFFEGGATNCIASHMDDYMFVTVDGYTLISSGEKTYVAFSYVESGWHKVELRFSNDGGPGGGYSLDGCSFWGRDGTRRRFVTTNGLFRTDAPDSYVALSPTIVYSGSGSDVDVSCYNNQEELVINLLPWERVPSSAFIGNTSITGITVRGGAIGSSAFANCRLLERIDVQGCLEIGEFAFKSCTNLSGMLVIPDGVSSIGKSAFEDCKGLTSVTIEGNVSAIGESAFQGCRGLTAIAIGRNVGSIGLYAFKDCEGLTSVVIADGTLRIEESAFYECKRLVSIVMPSTLKSIQTFAFHLCNNLKRVVIPSCVTSIAGTFPASYQQIESIELVGEFRNIPADMFAGCTALKTIILPDGVTRVGDGAFAECESLESATIPASVTSFGDEVFADCLSLKTVRFLGNAPDVGVDVFWGTPRTMSVQVSDDSVGWSGGVSTDLPSSWCDRAIAYAEGSGGGSGTGGGSGGAPVIVTNDCSYVLTDHAADRAIASITVDEDCAIDEFVLKDGKVYDCVLRIVNTAEREVTLTLPAGYEYEAFKGARPLRIPESSRNIITITRTSDRTFLVSREELETVQ